MMADGRVEYEIRGDISHLDSDLDAANKKIISAAQKGASEQEKSHKKVEQAVKSSNDNIQSDTEKTERAIADAVKEESEKAAKYHKQASDEMAEQSRDMGNDIKGSFSDMSEDAIGKIGKMVTAMAALKEAADFAKTAISEAVANETAFAKVNTLLADGTNTQQYYNRIKASSLKTGVNFADLSESVYGAISASVDQDAAVDFVETAVKLSKGGFTQAATAVDVLTTAINAYDLEASEAVRVSDVLITTQNLGKTTVDELASSMGQTIPIANSAGVAIEDLATQYAIMTKNGVATAESGTQIKAMLNELNASGTKASKALLEVSGKSFSQLQAEGKNTAEILAMLSDYADKNNVKLSDLFGSVEAGAAALTLVKDGGKDFCDVLEQMGNSAGAAEKAYETMANTTEERYNRLKNSMTVYVSEVGEKMLPIIEEFFDYLEEHSEEVEDIVSSVGEVLSWLLKIVIGAAEAAWKYKDALVALAAAFAVTKLINSFSSAVSKAGSTTAALKNAINPTALAFSALAVAAAEVYSKMRDLNEVTEEYNRNVADIEDRAKETVSSVEAENRTIEEKVERYDQLRTAADLTAAQEEELKAIAGELQGVFGEDVTVIDQVTGKYNDLSDALEKYTQKRIEAAKREAAYGALEELYAEKSRLESEIQQISKDFNSEDYAWAASYGSDDVSRFSAATLGTVEPVLGKPVFMSGTNAGPEEWLKYRENQDALNDITQRIKELEGECGELDKAFYDTGNAASDTKDKINGTSEAVENNVLAFDDLKTALASSKAQYDLLTSAEKEFNETGALSVSTLESIVQTYPALQEKVEQYLAGLIDERELISAMTDAYDADQQNYYRALMLKLGYQEDFVNAAFDGEDAMVQYFADKYGIDLRNYKNYIDAKQKLQAEYNRIYGEYLAKINEAGQRGDWTGTVAYSRELEEKLAPIRAAIDDLDNFYNENSDFWIDYSKIKQRSYDTVSAGSVSTGGSSYKSGSSSVSSSGNKSSSTSGSSSAKNKTATSSASTSNGSGGSGGQVINITSYIPTTWDEAAKANEKLIAGGVAANLVGNSKSGKLITGLDSNTSAGINGQEITDATLNDVVKAIKGLEEKTADMEITVTAMLTCDSVTLARQAIKGIKAIEKSTGKSPL